MIFPFTFSPRSTILLLRECDEKGGPLPTALPTAHMWKIIPPLSLQYMGSTKWESLIDQSPTNPDPNNPWTFNPVRVYNQLYEFTKDPVYKSNAEWILDKYVKHLMPEGTFDLKDLPGEVYPDGKYSWPDILKGTEYEDKWMDKTYNLCQRVWDFQLNPAPDPTMYGVLTERNLAFYVEAADGIGDTSKLLHILRVIRRIQLNPLEIKPNGLINYYVDRDYTSLAIQPWMTVLLVNTLYKLYEKHEDNPEIKELCKNISVDILYGLIPAIYNSDTNGPVPGTWNGPNCILLPYIWNTKTLTYPAPNKYDDLWHSPDQCAAYLSWGAELNNETFITFANDFFYASNLAFEALSRKALYPTRMFLWMFRNFPWKFVDAYLTRNVDNIWGELQVIPSPSPPIFIPPILTPPIIVDDSPKVTTRRIIINTQSVELSIQLKLDTKYIYVYLGDENGDHTIAQEEVDVSNSSGRFIWRSKNIFPKPKMSFTVWHWLKGDKGYLPASENYTGEVI